nr:MAG TPA: hypothetical protein [Caudoviricetes sp.]
MLSNFLPHLRHLYISPLRFTEFVRFLVPIIRYNNL